jgi:hypothetical protein
LSCPEYSFHGSFDQNLCAMKEILDQFFSSNEFWQKFEVVKEFSKEPCYTVHYRYKYLGDNILLRFFECQGVKSVSVVASGRIIVDGFWFLNFNELNLILNRVCKIRAANPLCSGSLSITALSLLSKNENQFQHPSS